MSDIYTNSIVSYLIRERYSDFESIIETGDQAASIDFVELQIEGAVEARFYYRQSHGNPPDWLRKFFGNNLEDEVQQQIYVSNAQAIVLLKVPVSNGTRFFAISFGTGRFLIKPEAIERNFGLRTVLNLTEANQIRHLDKKVISSNPKQTREQIAIPGQTAEFGVDIDRDILKGITGTSTNPRFGKSITGTDAYKASVQHDISSIAPWFSDLFEQYQSEHYKEAFSWVDLVAEVKDDRMIAQLDNHLLGIVNSRSHEEVHMAVPEIIDWEKVQGCKYSTRKRDEFAPGEINLTDFLSAAKPVDEDIDLDFLKTKRITAQDSDGNVMHNWPAYRCLVTELTLDDHLYLLSDATWFQVDRDFKSAVDAFFDDEMMASSVSYVNYTGQHEDEFNSELSKKLDAACMDKKNVRHGGGHSTIEVCDVLTPDKQLIHVKKYAGSAPLSHLFSQGLVSSQLLLGDQNFRRAAYDKIPDGKKRLLSVPRYKSADWTVIFAVLGRNVRELPFFSKVTLRLVAKDLTARGYSVQLDFIPKT